MPVISVVLSISSVVLNNCLHNNACKSKLKSPNDINTFNTVSYLVCIFAFGILLLRGSLSVFTALLAILFGIVTALGAMYNMMALSKGPMHITLLITTSSMIIPTLSGVFFGEEFSPFKLLATLVLVFFVYLSLDKKSNKKTNRRWLFYCMLAFVTQGAIGVIQKIHQSSKYKSETGGFLFITFIFSVVFGLCKNAGKLKLKTLGKTNFFIALICGICIFTMNYINLKLSGILPSQLFFPLINGSSIILSSLASVILFKELLSQKQLLGLIGGIASLIIICLVP